MRHSGKAAVENVDIWCPDNILVANTGSCLNDILVYYSLSFIFMISLPSFQMMLLFAICMHVRSKWNMEGFNCDGFILNCYRKLKW